jgi:hypothetical protein
LQDCKYSLRGIQCTLCVYNRRRYYVDSFIHLIIATAIFLEGDQKEAGAWT